ncbi:hypothetical protein M0R45_005022 [Rubus argutus]|uniref:Uncharacterized protein n=1 Tax=Rubus argutus TaxID=59490 RepID=A0AAW1YM13_RUBAR
MIPAGNHLPSNFKFKTGQLLLCNHKPVASPYTAKLPSPHHFYHKTHHGFTSHNLLCLCFNSQTTTSQPSCRAPPKLCPQLNSTIPSSSSQTAPSSQNLTHPHHLIQSPNRKPKHHREIPTMAVPKLTTTSPFASRVHYQTSNLCPVQSRLHSHHHVLTFTNSISPKSSPQPHQAVAYLNLPHFHSIRAIPNQPAPPFSANTLQPFNNHSITIIIQSPIIQDSDHRDLITAHFDKPRPHLSRRTSCAVPTPCSSAASKPPGRADRFLRRRRREPRPFSGAPPPLLARAPALPPSRVMPSPLKQRRRCSLDAAATCP